MQLLIDTSQGQCSVAIVGDGGLLGEGYVDERSKQAEELIPLIDRVLLASGASMKDIQEIGCIVGPGSFTGIRIGLACAKGLQIAGDIPVIGINALEVMAWAARSELAVSSEHICVVLDGARSQVFFQIYQNGAHAVISPSVASFEDAISKILGYNDICFIGGGGKVLTPFLKGREELIRHESLFPSASLAGKMLVDQGWDHEVLAPDPLYLREADVTKPKKGRV